MLVKAYLEMSLPFVYKIHWDLDVQLFNLEEVKGCMPSWSNGHGRCHVSSHRVVPELQGRIKLHFFFSNSFWDKILCLFLMRSPRYFIGLKAVFMGVLMSRLETMWWCMSLETSFLRSKNKLGSEFFEQPSIIIHGRAPQKLLAPIKAKLVCN